MKLAAINPHKLLTEKHQNTLEKTINKRLAVQQANYYMCLSSVEKEKLISILRYSNNKLRHLLLHNLNKPNFKKWLNLDDGQIDETKDAIESVSYSRNFIYAHPEVWLSLSRNQMIAFVYGLNAGENSRTFIYQNLDGKWLSLCIEPMLATMDALNAGEHSKDFIDKHLDIWLQRLTSDKMYVMINALNDSEQSRTFIYGYLDAWLDLSVDKMRVTKDALSDGGDTSWFIHNNVAIWCSLSDNKMIETRHALNTAPQLVLENIDEWIELDEDEMRERLRPYQNEAFNPNDEQSVHSAAIEFETLDIFNYIQRHTQSISPYASNQIFTEFKNYLIAKKQNNMMSAEDAKKLNSAISFLDNMHFESPSLFNGHTLKQILAMVINASANSSNNTLEWVNEINLRNDLLSNHMTILVDALYESKNAYDIDENGQINEQDNEDNEDKLFSCWGGVINRIILSLQVFIDMPVKMPKKVTYMNEITRGLPRILIELSKMSSIDPNGHSHKIINELKIEIAKLDKTNLNFNEQIFSILEPLIRSEIKASFPACRKEYNKDKEEELWCETVNQQFKENILPYLALPQIFIDKYL